MTERYVDPKTGFIITSNSDSWRADQKQLPESIEPEPPPTTWGDVGQGVRTPLQSPIPSLEELKDFRVWTEHKKATLEAAKSGYYQNFNY